MKQNMVKRKVALYGSRQLICVHKTDDIYKDTSNYELDRPLPKGTNKKVIGLMKDKLGEKIMTKFVWVKAKAYSSLIDDGSDDKKANGTKKFS